jgi:D-3-phosphoglycerate dehydrogenase
LLFVEIAKGGSVIKPHILVTEHLGARALSILEAEASLEAYDLLPEDRYRERLREADAVIIRSAHSLRAHHFALAPRLRVAARAGAGVDNIDIAEATRRGILVINTPGANAVAAAEHTLGLMLAVMRNIVEADRHVRSGGWNRQAFFGRELSGRRLGIIGLGRVGSRVAQRARAFGTTVYAYDPYLSPDIIRERGAEPVQDLGQLLAVSDVLTLHTPKTGPKLGRAELEQLPEGAVVLNVARGGLLDEDALYDLLEEGRIWGVGLDVFAKEPPPPGHRLLKHPRVTVTCHLGGSTEEAQDAIGEQVVRSVLDALEGRIPAGAVNVPVPEGARDPERLVVLGRLLGQLLAVSGGQGRQLMVEAKGPGAEGPHEFLARAVAWGYLEAAGEEGVNLVSAVTAAAERGIAVTALHALDREAAGLELGAWFEGGHGHVEVADGPSGPRLRRYWEARFDVALAPYLLVTRHHDRPGIVGALGTVLGDAGINIATMELSRSAPGGEAVMLMGLDNPVPPEVTARIRALDALRRVETLSLRALWEEAGHAF